MRLSHASIFQKYLYFLVHFKGLLTNSFAKKYYGQWGEDVILIGMFPDKKDGFYVDVGAFHPMHYSNTYLLYKKGWHGINIDPNPWSIRLFNLHRRRDVNLNYGVNKEASIQPYFIFNHQSCNTFSEKQKEEMLKRPFMRLIKETEVSCLPLRTILSEHAQGREIDLLNIDVEGMSMEVLQSFDWGGNKPKVIAIEDDDFDLKNKEESHVFAFLSEQGYVFHVRVGVTCIYKRNF